MPAWAVAGYVAGSLDILLPLLAASVVAARLGVGWRYFGYGALVFFVFQIATRVPITQLLQVAVAPRIAESRAELWAWLAFLALTAGLFEELGRYVGFRVLWRRDNKTWERAVMYGLGHGGLESMALIGAGTVLTVFGLSQLLNGGLATLPEAQRAVTSQQLEAVAAQPTWVWALGVWERVCALAIQVCLSVLVLQVFVRGSLNWLGLALVAHILVDGVTLAVPEVFSGDRATGVIVTEGCVTLFAVAAVFIVSRLRRSPAQVASKVEA